MIYILFIIFLDFNFFLIVFLYFNVIALFFILFKKSIGFRDAKFLNFWRFCVLANAVSGVFFFERIVIVISFELSFSIFNCWRDCLEPIKKLYSLSFTRIPPWTPFSVCERVHSTPSTLSKSLSNMIFLEKLNLLLSSLWIRDLKISFFTRFIVVY